MTPSCEDANGKPKEGARDDLTKYFGVGHGAKGGRGGVQASPPLLFYPWKLTKAIGLCWIIVGCTRDNKL